MQKKCPSHFLSVPHNKTMITSPKPCWPVVPDKTFKILLNHTDGPLLMLLVCVQITGDTVGEVKPVADMHQRKAEMARQSDAFIALPGNIQFILINIRVLSNYQAEPTSCSSLFIVPFAPCLVMSHTACVVEA
jgi:hypothetical protein